jgi:hypothetical protein
MTLSFRIKPEEAKIWESFKMAVLSKHGKLHGALGTEVVKALKHYLEDHHLAETVHPPTPQKPKKEKRVRHAGKGAFDRVKERINYMYVEGIKQVPKGEIEAIIMEELGVHSTRKVKEYLALLSRQMFLMPHPNNPNLVFLDRACYYEILNSINMPRSLAGGGHSRASMRL